MNEESTQEQTQPETQLATSDEQNSISSKILKNALKVGLTTLSPPIGLASFGKSPVQKAFLAGAGVALSAGANVAKFSIDASRLNENIYTIQRPSEGKLNSLMFLTSPWATQNYSQRDTLTFLHSSLEEYSLAIEGKDTILFNVLTKEYELNFGKGVRFDSAKRGLISLAESEEDLQDARDEVQEIKDRLTSAVKEEGDLYKSRSIREELAESKEGLLENLADHEALTKEYNTFKAAYQSEIDSINRELESLGNTDVLLEEDAK